MLFCFFHDDDRSSGRPKDAAAGPEPAGAITPVCGVPVCSCPRKCRCLLDPDSTGRGDSASPSTVATISAAPTASCRPSSMRKTRSSEEPRRGVGEGCWAPAAACAGHDE